MFWPESKPDKIYTKGLVVDGPYILVFYVWLWSLFWWFVEDAAKVYSKYDIISLCFLFLNQSIYKKHIFWRRLAVKYNLFNINDDGVLKLPESAIKVQKKMLDDELSSLNKKGGHSH